MNRKTSEERTTVIKENVKNAEGNLEREEIQIFLKIKFIV